MNVGQWFRNLWRFRWFRWVVAILGYCSILIAVWIGLPLIPWKPFQNFWVKLGITFVLIFPILLISFIRWRRRRKAARELEESLATEPEGDQEVLAERMSEALAKLKKAGGASSLYDLPWYIIIGPPGAGKTTALKNSGIEFPGSDGDPVEGFGGTKNCDFWFAEDAVLIDTAGRYTTQDSNQSADSASWEAFLDNLKRGRPDQPINGVILAFSAEDMMTATPEQLEFHANTVRERLAEVHERLRIDFPVYVMFTKADMISGFREYFSSFNQSRRKSVWGVTFQTKDRKAETWQKVPEEFDALVSRLSDEVIDRMSEEPDGVSRIAIFGLPGQMALLRDNVSEFLRLVFQPSQYKTNAILRGFYFTSGTQEGTPIDQVLGAMARNEETSDFAPAFMSGKGKSFFLHDLLKKVIFEERDWVSFDARAVRRRAIFRGVVMTSLIVATLGVIGAFGWSFWQNHQLVQQAAVQQQAYFGAHQSEIGRTEIDDPSLRPVMDELRDLRLLPAGYADDTDPSFWEGMGLNRRRSLNLAAERAYSDGLERMLRPRLLLHLENELQRLLVEGGEENAEAIFRALKVYILLGKQQPDNVIDDDAIQAYFEDVWAREYNQLGEDVVREELAGHLKAMLELDDARDTELAIANDATLVEDARAALVNISAVDQAYASIKDRAAIASLDDVVLVDANLGNFEQVFETKDGTPIEEVMIPGLYTYTGYWGFFLEELELAATRLEEDKWVLGERADQVEFDQQLAGLERELHREYEDDFYEAWSSVLGNLAFRPLATPENNYQALDFLSGRASPLLELVELVERETRLVRLYEQMDLITPEMLATGSVGAQVGDNSIDLLMSRSGTFERIFISAVRDRAAGKDPTRIGGSADEGSQRRQVERISERFDNWHEMLLGDPGSRPIDGILANLRAIYDNRRTALVAPSPTDEQTLQSLLVRLTGNNAALPDELAGLLNEIENEFRNAATDATIQDLQMALTNDVANFCVQNIEPLFPFSNGRHVAPAVFGQFFGYGGRMDRFYTTYLAPHVSRTSSGLVPVPDSPIADRLNPEMLKQFERANAIKEAFFLSGGADPTVGMSVSMTSASQSVQLVSLTINGDEAQLRAGAGPDSISWPGSASGVNILLFPAEAGRSNERSFTGGRWSIIEFLRNSNTSVSGNVATVVVNVGGRTVTLKFEFESTTVPFMMEELRDFECPTRVE